MYSMYYKQNDIAAKKGLLMFQSVKFIMGTMISLISPHTPTDTCNTSANWQASVV